MPVCRRPKSLQSAGGYAIIFSYFIIEEGLHVIGRNQTTQTAKQTLPKRTRRHLQRYAADGRQMGERGDHAQDGSSCISVQLFRAGNQRFYQRTCRPRNGRRASQTRSSRQRAYPFSDILQSINAPK